MKPPPADPRVSKWTRWAEGIVCDEVTTMHYHRAVYQSIANIVNSREPKLPPSLFFEYLGQTYVATQATAIRRQAERSSRVVSLGTLLVEIQEEPERLSRSRYLALFPAAAQWLADRDFSEKFGGEVGQHLDPQIVATDLSMLDARAKTMVTYVDQHLAHRDRRPGSTLPTYDDMNAAIDMIGELFSKYMLLLTAVDQQLVPVPQYNWQAIFEVPWVIRERASSSGRSSVA